MALNRNIIQIGENKCISFVVNNDVEHLISPNFRALLVIINYVNKTTKQILPEK